MNIKKDYENKAKEVEGFNEDKLTQSYCQIKLKQLLDCDITLPESFQPYFKISTSTNNISTIFRDHNFEFYCNIEIRINKKNKSIKYSIKDYSLNNIEHKDIHIMYIYNELMNTYLKKINYDFFIDLFNKKSSLKKEKNKLNKELSILESKYFYEKNKKEIQNINMLLKPLSEQDINEFVEEVKKGHNFNLVTKSLEENKIIFKNTIFSFENNTFNIDYMKVKKEIFIEHLKEAFSFEKEIVNQTKFLFDKLKLKNNNQLFYSFDISYIHDKILPLIIKEKSDIF